MKKLIRLTDEEYNKLTSINKNQRVSKFVCMINEIDRCECTPQGLNKRKGTIKKYLKQEDLKYMDQKEIDIFIKYGFVSKNNKIIRK
jgi:hypothetical protein